jgi:ATP-binding cassette subfamily B protein
MRVIDGTLTLGTMGAFLAYQMRVFAPAQALMGLWASLTTAKVSWARVLEILDAPIDVDRGAGREGDRDPEGELSSMRCRSAPIASRVCSTRCRSSRGRDRPSRSSAAAASASRRSPTSRPLLDPDAGVVRFDGQDLRSLHARSVRRHIVLVEQEPTLLHRTIEENIRYVRRRRRRRCRDGRGGRRHRAFHQGLPTVTRRWWASGAGGVRGERQRIALARAFLADPAVLVMDEPTAALDAISQRQIIEGSRAVMRGRTTF